MIPAAETEDPPPPAALGAALYLALWKRLAWRHWAQDRWSTLLLLGLLSLGVAAFLSIRMANREAVAGFATFTQSIQPRTDWTLRSPAGRLRTVELPGLRARFGLTPARLVPVLEVAAVRAFAGNPPMPADAPKGPSSLRLVGLDLIALGGDADMPLAPTNNAAATPDTAAPRLWMTATKGHEWGLEPGVTVALIIGSKTVRVALAGWLPAQSSAGETPANLGVMDLPDLQAAADLAGWVDRVEVVLPSSEIWAEPLARTAEDLRSDPAWRLAEPAEDAASEGNMTAAFRLNLTILSLIALLVAVYLIAQALDAVVVRRRQEIGILRSLGMTPGMLRTLWLVEFLLLGLLGSFGGLLLGWAMAQGTAGAVAETVRRLYHPTEPAGFVVPQAGDLVLALLLGVGGSLVGGILPLRDAASTPPAQVLAAGNFSPGFGLLRRPRWGLALIALGGLCWMLPPVPLAGGARFPLGGYASAFALAIGGTLAVGSLFRPLAGLLRVFDGIGGATRLARSRLEDATSRHRLAAAGLFVAVAMAGGMGILVGSFSRTMTDWIEVRFQADLYVSSAAGGGPGQEFLLAPESWQAIASLPEVRAADPFRLQAIELNGRRTYLGASRQALIGPDQKVLWLREPADPATAPAPDLTPAFVNEAFAARFEVSRGDVLTLPTPSGDRPVWIRGVFADYGNEQGLVWIDWPVFVDWFGHAAATNLSLFLQPGTDPLLLAESIRTAHPELYAFDNAGLREVVQTIFRQTFAVTEALNLIAIGVAIGGLALALTNLLRESRVELDTLRRLGFRRREIARATALESAGIALVGFLAGALMSLALGLLLVFVINRQSFGWTLQWHLAWTAFATLGGLTVALALFVGAIVGWKHGKGK